jgi:hypothetical protein
LFFLILFSRPDPAICADQRQILRILDDIPVRLTTKPFPGTFGSYEKGRLFFLNTFAAVLLAIAWQNPEKKHSGA